MSELHTLHVLDQALARRYVAAIIGRAEPESVVPAAPDWSARVVQRARVGYERARVGQELGANMMTLGLAQVLATAQPTFYLPNAGLTAWEARIERGTGMFMRPPSRLFGEEGMPVAIARGMPIRIDPEAGMMGGAYIPARLIPDLQRRLDAKAEQIVRRLVEAEYPDPVPLLGLMIEAVDTAAAQGMGLFEALDAVIPDHPDANPPGARVHVPDRRRLPAALRVRLETAAKPPKKPGLVTRLLRRGAT